MRAGGTTSEPHDAYLHALNRAVAVGVALSCVVHAVLIGWLPNPFGHFHALPRTLEVELVEAPVPPAPVPLAEPLVEQAPAPPVARPAPAEPPPAYRQKRRDEPKPVRERKMEIHAPTVREPDRVLAHAEPEKAVTAVPLPAAAAPAPMDKPAVSAPEAATERTADSAPETPPSFRAGYLHNPEPAYPTASRRLGEEGSVQLRVVVSAEGRAMSVDVQRSSGFSRLDEAAADAVRKWRFVPAKRGATAIEATVIVPIVFRLEAE